MGNFIECGFSVILGNPEANICVKLHNPHTIHHDLRNVRKCPKN